MFNEERKINLIEAVIKISDETTLNELEMVLEKKKILKKKSRPKAQQFSGVWSHKDVKLIDKAIEEGCEQINEDEWK